MRPGDFRKAAWRTAMLIAPLIVVMAVYIIFDPFRVLWSHDFANYYSRSAPVEANRDYASLQIFLKRNPQQHYDSFMLGSSRSFPLHAATWKKFVPDMRPFHYPAATENLYGIYRKVKFLEERKIPLRHVIIEINILNLYDISARQTYMHRLPRELTGESWLAFQKTFLSSYFHDLFFVKYGLFLITGQVFPFARDALGSWGRAELDPITNDFFFLAEERELAENEEAYYVRRAAIFQRGPKDFCYSKVIWPEQQKLLEEIREIFVQNGTDFRIMIPPAYDQICTSAEDTATLHRIFGASNVFDFSGVNEWTADMKNFYDATHVRPLVGDKLIEAMYRSGATGLPKK